MTGTETGPEIIMQKTGEMNHRSSALCYISDYMRLTTPWIVKSAVIVLLLGVLIQVLYDPLSSAKHSIEVSRMRAEIPKSLAKWKSQGITSYTFEITGNAPSICRVSARIEVKNDAVARVETKDFSLENSPAQLLSPDKWADPDWGDEVFLCNYAHFTMTRIFDLLDRTLRDNPSTILQVGFDSNYGFITFFHYGLYSGHGLLSPQISDLSNSLRIRNFQPETH
jgi:hypothetical protein